MSIESSELDLNRNGYIMVSGVNENPDDNAKSNGSGKSTIFESVVWCLTGETMRGTKDVKRFGAKDKCEVTLDFKVDNDDYQIVRTKDPSNLFIYKNGENKSGKGVRDTADILKQYIPDLTSQLIGSVIVMGQGLPMRFTNNSPSGRKDVLEKLSKSDFMIEDLKNRVASRKSSLLKDKREVEDTILTNNTLISSKSIEIDKLTAELQSLKTTDYDTLIASNEASLDSYSKEVESCNKQIETLNTNITGLADKKDQIIKNKFDEKQAILNKYSDDSKKLNEKYIEINSDVSVLSSKINSINNIKTHCPTCGQPLKDVKKPDTTVLQEDLKSKLTILNTIKSQISDIDNAKILENTAVDSKYAQDEANILMSITSAQNGIAMFSKTIRTYNQNIKDISNTISNLKIQKSNLEYRILDINSKIKNYTAEIDKAKNDNNILANEISNLDIRLDIIAKFEIALKRDFRGILLSNIINYIDQKAKEYSNIVFGTDKLEFKLDGNNISISYCGKEYESLSGGEKARVDLIVQFAIRDMLCKYLNFSSNILVIDEIFDGLDKFSCQKVIDLIAKKLNDVSSIYVVSHHSDIAIPMDHEIFVVKNRNGISEIRV